MSDDKKKSKFAGLDKLEKGQKDVVKAGGTQAPAVGEEKPEKEDDDYKPYLRYKRSEENRFNALKEAEGMDSMSTAQYIKLCSLRYLKRGERQEGLE